MRQRRLLVQVAVAAVLLGLLALLVNNLAVKDLVNSKANLR